MQKRRRKRDRKKAILLLVIAVFLLLFCTCDCRLAVAEEEYTQELNESIFEQINQLDLAALEEYVGKLLPDDSATITERLLDYIQGGSLDYASFFQDIVSILFADVKRLLPSFACIAAVTLLCGILSALKSQYLSGSTGQSVFLIAYIGTLLPILSILTECISAAQSCVSSMQQQMQIVFPIMLTLMAASGGVVSAEIYQPAVAFLCNTLISIIGYVVFPLTIAVLAFTIAGHLFGEMKFAKFTAFFKGINKWIIGIGVSVFGLFFSVQGITAAHYDGIAKRAAKYALGAGVPIVGGFLSGGFDLALAGSILIKNSLGNLSLFLLASVLLGPLILLISVNLLLRLTAAVTQPFGDSKIADFLGEAADTLNFFTAGLLFTAFLYFIVVLLIVCSSEAFF